MEIQIRDENTVIPNGLSITYSGFGRLWIRYQETNIYDTVKRLTIAIPARFSELSLDSIKTEMFASLENFKKGELTCQDNLQHQL